jgi:hypothetical protein
VSTRYDSVAVIRVRDDQATLEILRKVEWIPWGLAFRRGTVSKPVIGALGALGTFDPATDLEAFIKEVKTKWQVKQVLVVLY